METISLIASIVAIILAFFAIWQANHHRDQSDKLNRDTTEKLSRIEAFASLTKEDAFAEIKRWGDFARAGGKTSEEAEKAKEEDLTKLKQELQNMTSEQINKVLQTVEGRLSSTAESSDISEIRKEFEELKMEIGTIQEKGIREVRTLDAKAKFGPFWTFLFKPLKDLLKKAASNPLILHSELKKAGVPSESHWDFFETIIALGVVDGVVLAGTSPNYDYEFRLTSSLREFLENLEKDEME